MNQSQVWNMRVSFNNISYGLGRFCSAHSARWRAYKFIFVHEGSQPLFDNVLWWEQLGESWLGAGVGRDVRNAICKIVWQMSHILWRQQAKERSRLTSQVWWTPRFPLAAAPSKWARPWFLAWRPAWWWTCFSTSTWDGRSTLRPGSTSCLASWARGRARSSVRPPKDRCRLWQWGRPRNTRTRSCPDAQCRCRSDHSPSIDQGIGTLALK